MWTRPRLARDIREIEDFFWKGLGLFQFPSIWMVLLRRCLLKTSCHNQRKLLGKWENPNFEEQGPLANYMAKGKIGRLPHKPLPYQKNSGRSPKRIIGRMSAKSIPLHWICHLLLRNRCILQESKIIGWNDACGFNIRESNWNIFRSLKTEDW